MLALLAGSAAAQRTVTVHLATASIAAAKWPYLPGSRLALRVSGISPPYGTAVLGAGRMLDPTTLSVPLTAAAGDALAIVGNTAGLGVLRLRIAAAPDPRSPLLFVASYDDGAIVHDARTFAVKGVLGIAGAAADIAITQDGNGIVADTQGDDATLFGLRPWSVRTVGGIPTGDETIVDAPLNAAFVTDRERNGSGALTRVGLDGSTAAVATGDAAEGIALDARRQIVYVANVNDGTIAAVDARTLRVRWRLFVTDRIFSLAISPGGMRLYAVANATVASPLRQSGGVFAVALFPAPHVVARSAPLDFPIGIALDPAAHRLFVSDEARGEIDVLDARSLRPVHAAVKTCAVPWKLTFDAPSERLYVPCAGDNAVDAIDVRRLRRIHGAPFATGGYPLSIAVWRQ
jgi:DNA-binding beta-propeller fold protein YncE